MFLVESITGVFMTLFRLVYSLSVAAVSFLNCCLCKFSTCSDVGNEICFGGACGSGMIAVKDIGNGKGKMVVFKETGCS